jgi:hypothetical protein
MKKSLENLLDITRGVRRDMHEPDEQGITAMVTGLKLDNTDGDARQLYQSNPESEEIVVTLRRTWDEHGTYSQIQINLATLIALARLAPVPDPFDENVRY